MKYIIAIICSIILPIFSFKEIKPKLCINCRYFITDNDTGEYGKCSLFTRETLKIHDYNFLVNGISKDAEKDYFYCSSARRIDDKCGIEGKFHKRKYSKNEIFKREKM